MLCRRGVDFRAAECFVRWLHGDATAPALRPELRQVPVLVVSELNSIWTPLHRPNYAEHVSADEKTIRKFASFDGRFGVGMLQRLKKG